MLKHTLTRLLPAALALSVALTGCGNGAASSSSAPAPDLSQPETPNYSLGLDNNGHYTGISALDLVTLPQDYEHIPVDESYDTVPEEDLQQAVDQFMAQFSTTTRITDRAVEQGDIVNLDYVGYLDGQSFEGGDSQGAGLNYTAGSQELIDDFLTQIIGVMPGETIDVLVTFPDPYLNNPDLSGKEAKFVTTIHYIQGEETAPALTDAFVTQYLTETFGYTSATQVKDQLAADLLKEQQYNYVLDWLYDNSTFQEIPEALIRDQLSILTVELEAAAATYQTSMEDLADAYGADSLDSLLEQYRPSVENVIRQNLMCQAVAEAQDITITDAELSEYFSTVLQVQDYSSYQDQYGLGYLCQLIQMEQVAQFLQENVRRT